MTAFFDYAGFSLHKALAFASPEHKAATTAVSLRSQIEETRAAIAASLGLAPPHIFLTMGTTLGFKQLLLHSSWFPDGGHVVASDLMYPKMYKALRARCQRVEVAPVSVATSGDAVAQCLASRVGAETCAVVTDVVDNRRGLAVHLSALRDAVSARNPDALIVLDASQAYGQLPQLADSASDYDMLVADLKKWCRYKTQTGLGFIAVPSREHARQLVDTTNTQFALHPEWLPAPVAASFRDEEAFVDEGGLLDVIGRADAGGADLLGWCGAAPFVNQAMDALHRVNGARASEFLGRLSDIQGPWRCWPEAPSDWTTGIVSLVGDVATMFSLHKALMAQDIACSLIPTNLPPTPACLDENEACLRFSFHDRFTCDEELTALIAALRAWSDNRGFGS